MFNFICSKENNEQNKLENDEKKISKPSRILSVYTFVY